MKRVHSGFTLIELLITVALVAILAGVALPGYREHVRKSRRAEAQAFLLSVAARQQQFLVDTRAYSVSLSDIGIPTPSGAASGYTITLTPTVAATPPVFEVTATPISDQTSERCGTLKIDQNGTKTAAISGCW
jgi:type IV pilus assembly protein PilE